MTSSFVKEDTDNQLFITFSAVFRGLIFDLFLPIGERVLEVLNLAALWQEGHTYWFGVTLALTLLPGALEMLYWFLERFKSGSRYSKKELAVLMICFGPLTFHIAVWINNVGHFVCDIRKGRFCLQKEYSESNVFKCLLAFTEQAPDILLQLFIIMILWKPEKEFHWYIKMGVLLIQMVSVSQVSVDHHLRELSGKKSLPRLRDTFRGIPFFFLHLLVRTLTLAVIAAYCRWALVVAVSTLIILNLCYVYCGLASTANKAVFTISASILVLVCFVAAKKAHTLGPAKCSRRFYYYYLFNSSVFTLVTAAALIVPAMLFVPDNCDSMPVFMCAPGCVGRTAFCLSGDNDTFVSQYEYLTFLLPSLIGLNLFCIYSVFLMGRGKVLMKY